jgi:hypothetical protein
MELNCLTSYTQELAMLPQQRTYTLHTTVRATTELQLQDQTSQEQKKTPTATKMATVGYSDKMSEAAN